MLYFLKFLYIVKTRTVEFLVKITSAAHGEFGRISELIDGYKSVLLLKDLLLLLKQFVQANNENVQTSKCF
jgi:Mg2+/Co2+ transporter CorC